MWVYNFYMAKKKNEKKESKYGSRLFARLKAYACG